MTLDTCESSTLTTTTSTARTTVFVKTKTQNQRHIISMHRMNTIRDRKWQVTVWTNTTWIQLWNKRKLKISRYLHYDCWSHKLIEFHKWIMKWSMTDVTAENWREMRQDIDSTRNEQYVKSFCPSKKRSSVVMKWSVQLERRQVFKKNDRLRSYCRSFFDLTLQFYYVSSFTNQDTCSTTNQCDEKISPALNPCSYFDPNHARTPQTSDHHDEHVTLNDRYSSILSTDGSRVRETDVNCEEIDSAAYDLSWFDVESSSVTSWWTSRDVNSLLMNKRKLRETICGRDPQIVLFIEKLRKTSSSERIESDDADTIPRLCAESRRRKRRKIPRDRRIILIDTN